MSFIFEALKNTTLPIGLDDISEKGQEMWEELVIDAYNNTSRGTRAYNSEKFCSMPIFTANWRFPREKKRVHTRCIVLPFFEHNDEVNSSSLYEQLSHSRSHVSRSIGRIVSICEGFISERGLKKRRDVIHPQVSAIFSNCEPRLKTTISTFTYFFIEVSQLVVLYNSLYISVANPVTTCIMCTLHAEYMCGGP